MEGGSDSDDDASKYNHFQTPSARRTIGPPHPPPADRMSWLRENEILAISTATAVAAASTPAGERRAADRVCGQARRKDGDRSPNGGKRREREAEKKK